MKKIYPLLFPVFFFTCSPDYSNIEPGSTQILKEQDSRIALLSVPANYTVKKSHPLFIALHGHGDIAPAFHDLWKPVCDSLGMILLTPQGTESAEIGYGWTLSGNSEKFLRNCIEETRKRANIDPDHIYIGGFSAGGSLSYYMALKYPHVFSGLITFGASFDKSWFNFAKTNPMVGRLRIYIRYGELEDHVSDVRLATSLLKKTGAAVQLKIYEDIGHTIPEPKRTELAKSLEFITAK
jgi:predicted esterase